MAILRTIQWRVENECSIAGNVILEWLLATRTEPIDWTTQEMSFKPRGIVKWHPFAAVTETGVIVEELHQLNSLTTKPHISQDIAEEMERVIAEAIETGVRIRVNFFRDNMRFCFLP